MLPDQLFGLAGLPEERVVYLALPIAEPRASACADVAAFVPVCAPVGPVLLQLDRNVVAVVKDVERTSHDASRATGAKTCVHDLVVKVVPLGLVGGGRHQRREYSVGETLGIYAHLEGLPP